MKTIFVIGGCGFIGRNLIKELLMDNENYVVCIDNLSTGKEANIQQFMNKVSFTFAQIDIKDEDAVFRIFNIHKPEIVFHLAAEPRIKICEENPIETFDNNVKGTLNVLEASKRFGTKRFVFASSSSVYGIPNVDCVPEYEERKPLSHYAIHKVIGEELCKLYWNAFHLETIILRLQNVYGEYQNPNNQYAALIPRTIQKCLDYESPEIYGDGLQTRDFIYVKDVVRAFISASELENDLCYGDCFNIGTGIATTISHTVNEIQIQTNTIELDIKYRPKLNEVKNIKADIDKAKELLNWEPLIDLPTGLKRTIEFYEIH